ncbi:DUF1269 domain-containing protein [Chitinophaga sp. Cy-1792]|uniref:DUF1269 domain-containing protein n=1 Tax=Chitinophaga sp. Cy-1792 TaxID=2608339 RepID=UPI001423ACC6|nr:DUF1269 domain-containing protein [Chitinophaga sp. Cy-1792]NIG54117.1 DUF1269 domain-containing protein [Chitinophaga sp. Cy-1792]
MTNIIIATFPQESQAVAALKRFTQLESIGDITIYESALVKKNANGETSLLETDSTTEGVRALSGMALGTLIGAFAGPVGILAGMLVGTISGAIWESNYYSFTQEFSNKIAGELQPGYTALIAEVDEDNEVFVDSYVKSLGGSVTRTDVDYEYEKFSDEQVEAIDEQIAADRAKIRTAAEADKAKLEKEIASLKDKRKERIAALRASAQTKVAHSEATLKEMRTNRLKSRIELYKSRISRLENELSNIK